MENYEIMRHIEDFKTRITELKNVVKLDLLKKEIDELEQQTFTADFYNDPNNAAKVIKELKSKKLNIMIFKNNKSVRGIRTIF